MRPRKSVASSRVKRRSGSPSSVSRPRGAQPRERQRRARAAGDDQAHRWRRVVQQEGEGVVDGPASVGVVVVEHEDEVAGQLQDLVAQSGEDGLELLLGRQGAEEGTRGLPRSPRGSSR